MSLLEMKVPTIGESVTEVTLSQWLKNDGEYVELDEPICEFESDKATLEFPAEAAGILKHVAAEGDDLEIGGLVAKIDTSASPPEPKDVPEVSPKQELNPSVIKEASPAPTSHATGHPSPAAAKMMRENSLKSSDITGSGKEGRITKEDVQKAIDKKASQEVSAEVEATPTKTKESLSEPSQTAKTSSFSREVRREKMSRMRRTIAKRLVSAKNNTAMLTTFNEVDLTEVIALRKKYQEQFVEKYGIKLGFMSIFSKACAQVLMEMPAVNAHLDGESLIFHDYADISIAISTPSGLVVPPVHNVESLDYHEIELRIKELAEKARDGKLTIKEMQGGTFTITNGGIFGSMMSTPILNEPQSAILGMHTIQQWPMAINGEVKIRPMMYLALSYDHRVIDGSTSVTFLVKVKKLLEDPITLFLGI